MKKLLLLSVSLFSLAAANGQYYLSGSSYTQNFNNLGNGLPPGWSVYTNAGSTSAGNDVSSTNYTSSPQVWTSTTGGFKNEASANNVPSSQYHTYYNDSTTQALFSDRALAVRQVSPASATFPNSDPGAAFVFKIANPSGLSNFQLQFKLQSLDSTATRTTTWTVDYGIGSTPSVFLQGASIGGTVTTGNGVYSNNNITVNFGSALNNQTSTIWIRIITVTATSGSNFRATTGIDDYNLTWSGTAIGQTNYRPVLMSKTPTGPGVPTTTNLKANFDRNISKGTSGFVYIKNENTHLQTIFPAGSPNITVSGKTATITGLNLFPGTTYHVTFDSLVFDTATYNSYGLYDTTAWRFTTVPVSIAIVNGSNSIPVTVLGNVTNVLNLGFSTAKTEMLDAAIFDISGRKIYGTSLAAVEGDNRIPLDIPNFAKGIYFIRLSNKENYGVAKFNIE